MFSLQPATRLAGTSRALLSLCFCLVACILATAAVPARAGVKEDGVAAYKAGKLKEARTSFENALKASPGDAASHYWLGLIYQRQGLVAQAKQQYEWVLSHPADWALKNNAQTGLSQLN